MSKQVRHPDIAEMRAFCSAVDLGSLGKAARLLHLSQPALSKRLQTLEKLAGVRLLDRSPYGVEPTPAGTKLYSEARKLLSQAEVIEDMMGALSESDFPIRLAASHTAAEFIIPTKLVEFEAEHDRHLSVELLIGNSGVVRELVRTGRAELGIAAMSKTEEKKDGLKELHFCDDEVVIAVPKKHAWAKGGEVDLDEFLNTPLILRDPNANSRRTVDQVLDARGLRLAPPLAEVGSTSAAKSTAIKENVPLVVSNKAVEGEEARFAVCSVRGLSFPRKFVILVAGEETVSSGARALLSHLLENNNG